MPVSHVMMTHASQSCNDDYASQYETMTHASHKVEHASASKA